MMVAGAIHYSGKEIHMVLSNITGNHSLTERFPVRRIQRVQPVGKPSGGGNRRKENASSERERRGNKGSSRDDRNTDQVSVQDTDQDKGRDEIHDDPINHPAHYTYGGIEVIDFLEACDFPFHLANAVKYISRAGRKDPSKTVEDLSKAVWYINRYIGLLEKRQNEAKEGVGK